MSEFKQLIREMRRDIGQSQHEIEQSRATLRDAIRNELDQAQESYDQDLVSTTVTREVMREVDRMRGDDNVIVATAGALAAVTMDEILNEWYTDQIPTQGEDDV